MASMTSNKTVQFSKACFDDLPAIITLLADDTLGQNRESATSTVAPEYIAAFNEISSDANNELIVGKIDNKVIAVLQITFIPNLTLKGTKRAQIEGVRVSSSLRGQGIGKHLFEYAFDCAKARGCKLVQLTTNKARPDAFRFYEGLGFKATHEGFKLNL